MKFAWTIRVLVLFCLATAPAFVPIADSTALAEDLSGHAPAPGPRIPFKDDDFDTGAMTTRVIIALGVAGLLVAGLAYRMKGIGLFVRNGSSPASGLRLIGTLRLTPRLTLFQVEFGNDFVLLAHSETGVTLLATRPGGPPSQAKAEGR